MNIKAVELMQLNKTLKFGEEPETKALNDVTDPNESQQKTGLNELPPQDTAGSSVAFMGKSAIMNKLKAGSMAAMMALSTLGTAPLTSCYDKTIQEVSIDMSAIMSVYQQMLSFYQQMLEQQKITNDQMTKMNLNMTLLLNEVKAGKLSAEEFYKQAYAYMMKDSEMQKLILNQLVKNGKTQEEANNYLQVIIKKVENGQMSYAEALDKIYSVLSSIDGKLDNIVAKLDSTIVKLDSKDEFMKVQLEEIKNYLKTQNNISLEQKQLLDALLVSVNKLGSNADVMNVLDNIAAMLKDFMVQEKENDEQTQALLKEALNYIAAVGFEMNRNFGNLISEVKAGNADIKDIKELIAGLKTLIEKRGDEGKDLGDKILNAITSINADMSKNFSAILEAINKGAQGSDGIRALLEKVLDKQDQNREAILDAMGKIKLDGGKLDLSSIEAMLKDLLEQSKKNGQIMSEIGGNVDVINITNKAILAKINSEAEKGDVRYNKLMELLNGIASKLGNSGSTAPAYDDTKLLEILTGLSNMVDGRMQELLDAIKDHDVKVTVDVTGQVECKCNCGKNHEGILGDLNNLMK